LSHEQKLRFKAIAHVAYEVNNYALKDNGASNIAITSWTTPQILLLCRHCRRWKQFAQYMALIIINSFTQPLIAFLHQPNKVWQIWRAVSTSLAPAKERLDALFVCSL